jgi:hypothetical protein
MDRALHVLSSRMHAPLPTRVQQIAALSFYFSLFQNRFTVSAVDAVNVRTHAPLPTRAQQIAALIVHFSLFQNRFSVSAVDAVNVRTHAPLPTRAQQIAALQSTEFDVLVIGGGATGKAYTQLVPILSPPLNIFIYRVQVPFKKYLLASQGYL